jgi:D-alanine-D-alanine ligase
VQPLDPARTQLTQELLRGCDVVVPMVHGTGGEDGVLQRQLELLGVPFVGSNATASALTFDKIRCQQWLSSAGIPVPASVVIRMDDHLPQRLPAVRALGLPLVVKPARQGSSVGVTIIDRISLLGTAVHRAAGFGSDVLIEEYIPGREFTVPVIDGRVFPAVQICPAGDWYDYRAKYMDDRTQYRVAPPDAPAELSELALRVCQQTATEGILRVDFRVTSQQQIRVLEVNTVPGMTSHSLVPMSAAHLGISLGELCESAMETAIRQCSTADCDAA